MVQDFEHGPRVLAGPVASMAQITRDNDALSAPVEAKSVTWTSDGFTVQGWLLAPKHVEPGRKYPMIVEVHGGPSAAATPAYLGPSPTRTLIEKGYFVFEPNPRGSYGQGEAFTRANVRDFGGGDLRDILAGVDAVEKTGAGRRRAAGRLRPLLRRLHDHVDGDPLPPLPCGGGRGGPGQLDQLLRRERDRQMDDPLLRRLGL